MKTAATLALLMLLTACAPQQKLLRHYESYSSAEPVRLRLTLSVFPANPEAVEDQPLILQLSERAQAELIRSLSAKMKNGEGNAKLMALLVTPTEAESAKCAWAGKTRLKKRLVINVLGDLPKPADRIDKLEIVLTMNGENAKRAHFLSWDRFASKYGDFNIGTAKFTQANKFNAGLGNTSSSAAVDATSALEKVFTLGYEKSNGLEESAAYALHRLSVGGELTENRARLVQEGGPNYTLFGSSIATVSLALVSTDLARVHSFVLMDGAKPLAPAAATMESCPDVYPGEDTAITAQVSGIAHVRLVKAGDGTVTESDDDVAMVTSELTGKPVELASPEDLSVQRFMLGSCKDGDPKHCTYLYVAGNRTRDGNFERVVLPSLESAAELRNWLIEQSQKGPVTKIGKHLVVVREESAHNVTGVKAEDAKNLVVQALPANAFPPKPKASAGR